MNCSTLSPVPAPPAAHFVYSSRRRFLSFLLVYLQTHETFDDIVSWEHLKLFTPVRSMTFLVVAVRCSLFTVHCSHVNHKSTNGNCHERDWFDFIPIPNCVFSLFHVFVIIITLIFMVSNFHFIVWNHTLLWLRFVGKQSTTTPLKIQLTRWCYGNWNEMVIVWFCNLCFTVERRLLV